jgi:hypothetical protein
MEHERGALDVNPLIDVRAQGAQISAQELTEELAALAKHCSERPALRGIASKIATMRDRAAGIGETIGRVRADIAQDNAK